jgi:hypothetical protein
MLLLAHPLLLSVLNPLLPGHRRFSRNNTQMVRAIALTSELAHTQDILLYTLVVLSPTVTLSLPIRAVPYCMQARPQTTNPTTRNRLGDEQPSRSGSPVTAGVPSGDVRTVTHVLPSGYTAWTGRTQSCLHVVAVPADNRQLCLAQLALAQRLTLLLVRKRRRRPSPLIAVL